MSHLHIVLGTIVILVPLGFILVLAAPRVRASIGPVSLRGTMLLSFVLFAVMCFAAIAECIVERRFLIYESVMVVGMGGVVAVRVARYLRVRGKT